MDEFIKEQFDLLGASPTSLDNKKNIKKIYEYMPVPREFKILWADIVSYGGYPAGIVITDRGIVFKATRDYVKTENEQRQKDGKGKKKSREDRLHVVYQIILWENYEPDCYAVETRVNEGKRMHYFMAGDQTLTEFESDKLKRFIEKNAEVYRKMYEVIEIVSDEAVFAGLNGIFLEDTYFNSAYGADQSKTGHGIYAEHAGAILDRVAGEKSTVVGGDNAKNGPDKLAEVDGLFISIQCKYYKTAGSSVRAAFKENSVTGKLEYRYYTLSNEPMTLEVPRDQYEKALESFRKRIENGQVPGVTNSDDAKKYIRKGKLTYAQARNLAKAGTFESITYDVVTGAVECLALCGISALVAFGVAWWQTKDYKKAANASLSVGIQVFGAPFAGKLLASQIARTGISKSLIPATDAVAKAIGPQNVQKIINATRALVGKKAIYGAAAQKSFAKALRTNILTEAVMFAAMETSDTIKLAQRKVSTAQYAKNMVSVLTSILVGGTSTLLAGAAISKIGEKTGKQLNNKLGGVVGAVAGMAGGIGGSIAVKTLSNLLHEDDAVITTRMFNACLYSLCVEYMLSEKELEELIKNLSGKSNEITKLQQKIMSTQKQYRCIEDFLKPEFEKVVKKREKISCLDEERMLECIDDLIMEYNQEETA